MMVIIDYAHLEAGSGGAAHPEDLIPMTAGDDELIHHAGQQVTTA